MEVSEDLGLENRPAVFRYEFIFINTGAFSLVSPSGAKWNLSFNRSAGGKQTKIFIATMSEEGGNNGGGGGDDLSGLSGFFFYVFIVHPATAWILRPGRFERKKSNMYAIGFLALFVYCDTRKSQNNLELSGFRMELGHTDKIAESDACGYKIG